MKEWHKCMKKKGLCQKKDENKNAKRKAKQDEELSKKMKMFEENCSVDKEE